MGVRELEQEGEGAPEERRHLGLIELGAYRREPAFGNAPRPDPIQRVPWRHATVGFGTTTQDSVSVCRASDAKQIT